jgi:hypothetical protein
MAILTGPPFAVHVAPANRFSRYALKAASISAALIPNAFSYRSSAPSAT